MVRQSPIPSPPVHPLASSRSGTGSVATTCEDATLSAPRSGRTAADAWLIASTPAPAATSPPPSTQTTTPAAPSCAPAPRAGAAGPLAAAVDADDHARRPVLRAGHARVLEDPHARVDERSAQPER